MGSFAANLTAEEFKEGFDRSVSRGPDETRVISPDDGVMMGFHRLAIMGLTEEGMQPFSLNGNFLVCNGEIYGFRKLKKELEKDYSFRSDSDCEILLPLYEKYGVGMFGMLDAEYALIIYDKNSKKLLAARDPIGIRPLFYGYRDGGIVFASVAENLVGLCKKIMPFPPGHFYDGNRFVCYCDVTKVKTSHDNISVCCENIKKHLVSGIKKRLDSDAPIGFLLSGGLDSSLVCAVSQRLSNRPIKTFAIGMNTDAIDLKYAKEVAEYIGSDHTEAIITKDDVLAAIEPVIAMSGTFDITTVRASIGMYLLCKFIHENTDIRVLMTGEISDELFGYKYTDFAPNAAEFQKESEKRVRELYMYDVLRADRCISVNSLEARVPFGDLNFVKYVLSINPELKLNRYDKGKFLLRKAFDGDYLPYDILYREKAAFSDAVGHSMVDYIKEYADSLYTEEEFFEKIKKYSHVPPFTKESLLYRELFEKYYPDQAEMISDFWMPNKNWNGCAVSDPSARVLSNYGNSGI